MATMPLPQHGVRLHYSSESLPTCTMCQRDQARWSFYTYTGGGQLACHDCFVLHREPADNHAELLLLPGEDRETVEDELAAQQIKVRDVSDVDVIIYELEQGLYDDAGLSRLLEAVTKRHAARARAVAAVLSRGALVRIVGPVRPVYIAGARGTVHGHSGDKVLVVLDRTVGRFKAGVAIPVPSINLVPIESANGHVE